MPGLSGGQRKLLLFELIVQRIATQENLLIVLDEPFAGVTDDFVPYIIDRLNEMRMMHNILLVTNDHVEALTRMADNTITVSVIDRSRVTVNGKENVDRELTLLAMSIGDEYNHATNNKDLEFFRSVEFSFSGGLLQLFLYVNCAFGLFVATFWDSVPGSEALVLIAGGLVSSFTLQPYLLQLVDWRVYMVEEADALLHSSKSMNKFLKLCVIIFLLFVVSCIRFWCQDMVIGTKKSAEFFFAIFFDNFSAVIALICFGLYTNLSAQACQILGSMPFLFSIFFSTTL